MHWCLMYNCIVSFIRFYMRSFVIMELNYFIVPCRLYDVDSMCYLL